MNYNDNHAILLILKKYQNEVYDKLTRSKIITDILHYLKSQNMNLNYIEVSVTDVPKDDNTTELSVDVWEKSNYNMTVKHRPVSNSNDIINGVIKP